ncbi:glycosyltransferase involved in cell wall biosynthesis [Pontibacter mucosus]|uniref:Glycosyltransferase involved in cell wall biosynthesis n=1 Tax=Pontibacter mucosus TaxID=1649266 RepID=A0A2T5Y3B1_9BACT|nr:glycosyltransferase family 2 protein [Pontibacter mucosus]PTX10668.1 glycosyltransferase involved in cell wall biosynthesis [Pontibacter mucosus]
MEELVSIVMPTHNRESMLTRAVESVLNQTYSNWELLIVDDASNDNTQQVVEDFISKDARIKYYKLERNQGACVARNKGITESNGDYITFLDSDDEYMADKVTLQVNCFKSSGVENLGVVSCGRIDFRDGIKYNEWVPNLKGNILQDLLLKNRIGAGTPFLMIKRSVIKDHSIQFDPNMPAGQDWDFLTQVCQYTNFDVVSKPLVKVHHHSGERVYNPERAVLAFGRQYEKYRHLLLKEAKVHDTFVLKMAVQSYVYGYNERALNLLAQNIIHKDFKVALWQIYMHMATERKSFLAKATFKFLKRATSL